MRVILGADVVRYTHAGVRLSEPEAYATLDEGDVVLVVRSDESDSVGICRHGLVTLENRQLGWTGLTGVALWEVLE